MLAEKVEVSPVLYDKKLKVLKKKILFKMPGRM